MQDIWADTDKLLVDRMSKKGTPSQTHCDDSRFTSSDESHDSDSDSSSRGSFTAVPQEFRPSLMHGKSPTTIGSGGNKFTVKTPSNSIVVPQKFNSNWTPSKFTAMRSEERQTQWFSNNLSKDNSPVSLTDFSQKEISSNQASTSSYLCTQLRNNEIRTKPFFPEKKEILHMKLPGPMDAKLPVKHENKSCPYYSPSWDTEISINNNILRKFDSTEKNQNPSSNISTEVEVQEKMYLPKYSSLPTSGKSLKEENNVSVKDRATKKLQEQSGEIFLGEAIQREKFFKPQNLPSADRKTSLKENNLSNNVGIALTVQKPKDKKTLEAVSPGNEKTLKTFSITEKPKYPEPKRVTMFAHPASPPNCTKYLPLKQSVQIINPKAPVFECIVSEEVKILRTRVIEFDFAKMNEDNHKKGTLNYDKDQELHYKMEKVPGNQKKNIKHINYMQRNKMFSTDHIPNFCSESKSVKWKSTLNTQNEMLEDNFIQKSQGKNNLETSSKDKFKWAVIQEGTEIFKQTLPRDKLHKIKCTNSELGSQNNIDRQHKKYFSRNQAYFYKNNFKCNVIKHNPNLNRRDDTELYSVRAANMLDNEILSSSTMKKTKFSQEENEDNQEAKSSNNQTDLPPLESKPKGSILEEKNPLIQYGKDISDLIIGSHIAFSTLFSFYNEWRETRKKLIDNFQQLEISINESSKKYTWYQDLPKVSDGIALVASTVPIIHPHIGVAVKIVSIISSLVRHFFKNSNTGDKVEMDESEITGLLLKDNDASNELYMYGLLCNEQFAETAKLIEEFHAKATNCEFFADKCLDADIMTFIQGMLDYNPKQVTFYKKLHKCFHALVQRGSSTLSRKFCEPFMLNSLYALDVIGYLDWRFLELNIFSVKYELEDIHHMIQKNTSTSMKDLASRIKNCISILNDQLKSVERSVSKVPLFNSSSFENLKLDSE